MTSYVALLAPSSNRVYAGDAPAITAAELEVLTGGAGMPWGVRAGPVEIAGVAYLAVELAHDLDGKIPVRLLSHLASVHALFAREGELLRPIPLERTTRFDDDLLTIPKYPGKTNEQLTRVLLNVTLASTPWGAAALGGSRRMRVLDPLAGRGTTLSWALTLGHDAVGVEVERREVEAYSAFLRTWLRRKRVKHWIDMRPLRRDGVHVADVLEARVGQTPGGIRMGDDDEPLSLTVYAADTTTTADLLGRHKVDVVVTDAPYGVVHGGRSAANGPAHNRASRVRDRSPAELLAAAVPVWVSVLRAGGAMGIAWNTHGLPRDELAAICEGAGLSVRDDPAYLRFGHRVDAGIHRDILVAVKPQG